MTHHRPFLAAVALAVALLTGCNSPPAPPPSEPPSVKSNAPVSQSQPTTQPAADAEEISLSNVVQLTRDFDRAGEAYFSPDANWIIFQGTPKGETHYAMYVAKLEKQGGEIVGAASPVRISPPDSRNTCGFFSPDGKTLIFASTAGKEKPGDGSVAGYQRKGGDYRWDFPDGMEIFRADDWMKQVTAAMAAQPIGAAVDLAKTPITTNDGYDAEGAFSPDGQWIVFNSRRGGDSELYVMKPDGSGAIRLTNAKGYDGGPFFSPDGRRILYRSDRKGNSLLQVFVSDLTFDAQGGVTGMANERQLTDDANVNWGPYFHPNGKHIVFATSAHGHQNYELYLMQDDGSHKTRLTYRQGFDGLPVFSPDGKLLMWSSKRSPDNTTQIFLARFTPPKDW